MRTHHIILGALCAAILAAGCQTSQQTRPMDPPSPKNPQFAGEMAKFNAQFPNAKADQYETESILFNNEKKFDEKGDCHGKNTNPVTIILLLDGSGRVTSTTTDVENNKAECFRKAYANVQFPKPPTVPYRKAIMLR